MRAQPCGVDLTGIDRARDLVSSDDRVRCRALRAFGYSEAAMKDAAHKPDQIELRYSAIGDDETLDAITSIKVRGDMAYMAVAVLCPNLGLQRPLCADIGSGYSVLFGAFLPAGEGSCRFVVHLRHSAYHF